MVRVVALRFIILLNDVWQNELLVKFSYTQDELLIEYVQENKVIIDNSEQKHKDVFYKEEIWKLIQMLLLPATSELFYYYLKLFGY